MSIFPVYCRLFAGKIESTKMSKVLLLFFFLPIILEIYIEATPLPLFNFNIPLKNCLGFDKKCKVTRVTAHLGKAECCNGESACTTAECDLSYEYGPVDRSSKTTIPPRRQPERSWEPPSPPRGSSIPRREPPRRQPERSWETPLPSRGPSLPRREPPRRQPERSWEPPLPSRGSSLPGRGPPLPPRGSSLPGRGPPLPPRGPSLPGRGPPLPPRGPSLPGRGPPVPPRGSSLPGRGPPLPPRGSSGSSRWPPVQSNGPPRRQPVGRW